MKWFKVFDTDQIPNNDTIKTIEINKKQICIINNNDTIIASQSLCPHAGGYFSGGWCKNGHLICPIHQYSYDLKTGIGAEGQGDRIDVYPTEIREDGLYVGFEKSWWIKL